MNASEPVPDSTSMKREYLANFLWPHNPGSIEEAGWEFANAVTEEYRELCWKELLTRVEAKTDEIEKETK